MIFPLQLLLVADEPAEAVLEALRRAGYDPRPHHVQTSTAAGIALEQRVWDAVLIGPGMPATAAWEVLGWLQRYPDSPPLFVATDDGAHTDVVSLIEGGARDVIPMAHLDRLGVAVARAVREHRARLTMSEDRSDPSDSVFYALAEHMPVGLYRSTEDGRILYANPALAQMLGYDAVDELLGEAIVDRAAYPRDVFRQQIEEADEVHGFEMRWERADGREIVTRENARAVRDADGNLRYYEGTMEDITEERLALDNERRRVEQLEALVRFSTAVDAAQSSDALYRAVIRVIEEAMHGDAAVLLGRDGDDFDIRAWSDSISYEEVQTGRTQKVWTTYPLDATPLLVRDERTVDEPHLVAPLRAFMRRAGLRSLGSFPLLHRGRLLGALVVFLRQPHTFSEGELRMAETLAWHVAGAISRWQAEARLRDSETTLRTITDTTGHVPYRLRFGAEVYDHLSPSIEQITGYTPEALRAAGGIDALTEAYQNIEGEALKEGQPEEATHYLALHHLRTAGGELRWIEDNAYPWVDESGHTVGLVGVLQDVTERHEREAAAREQTQRSLAQQRALNELSSLSADADTLFQRATAVAAEIIDTSRVGLWLVGEETDKIRCHHLTLRDGSRRSDHIVDLTVEACADVLGQQRVIIAPDLEQYPIDSALGLGAHTEEGGVRAVLIAPIRRANQVVGFVTFEHAGSPRTWTLDEQEFAATVADFTALALEQRQRAEAEEALRESERRYRAISKLGTDYAFAIRVEPGDVTHLDWATDAFERITGYAPSEIKGMDDLAALVHKEDWAECTSSIQKLIEGETVEFELRIVTKRGDERWISHRSRPVHDEQGRLVGVYSAGQDVTDRKQFEEALVAAREHAEELAHNKSTFLANMSHEIRTPLTGIIGFAGVLGEEIGEEHREFAHLIERSGRRLLETINSVLDLAQLESDRLEPTPQPLDLVDEARQAVLLLSPLAEAKNITLDLNAETPAVHISADPTCLHRVINNIVGNAIKFTKEGEVAVTIRADAEHAHLDVSDTGIGIDADFLPHLFNEFRQEAKKTEQEGSGLGLAITKKLVDLMDGVVTVESTKGAGSQFTVSFPLVASPPAEREGATQNAEPPVAVERPDERAGDESARADQPEPEEVTKEPVADAPSEPMATSESDVTLAEENVEPEESSKRAEEVSSQADQPEGLASEEQMPTDDDEFDEAALASILSGVDWTLEQDGGDGEAEEPILSLFNEHIAPIVQNHADEDEESTQAHASSERSDDDGSGRVLVVTDNATSQSRIVRAAEGLWKVETVADARAALGRMTKGRYAALILDVNLGGKQTGAGVLRVARALPGYEKVFAIALTSKKSERDYAKKAGFNCCLQDPFTNTALLDALRPAMSPEASAK